MEITSMGKFSGLKFFVPFIVAVFLCQAATAQKVRRYEATILFVSGFKERGILQEVNDQGIVIHDGYGSRKISPSGIRKIVIRPYRSGSKTFFSGTVAGIAGAGLVTAVRNGYQQDGGRNRTGVTLIGGGVVTGAYFWLMNTLIRPVVFKDLNEPGAFLKFRPRLERFARGPQDAV